MRFKIRLVKIMRFFLLTGFFALLFSATISQATTSSPNLEEYTLHNSWGGEGNVINHPADIAIGPNGRIYVANQSLHRITIITPGDDVFNNFGSFGYEVGQLELPGAIAIDKNGYIYVTGGLRVSKFDLNGEFILRWGDYRIFQSPSGIAVDGHGYVYVADEEKNQITKFTTEGTRVKTWGKYGDGDGELNQPRGLAVDQAGNILVADSRNHRIQVFSANGDYIKQWGNQGTGVGDFNLPMNVAIGNKGEIYVSDWGNYRVQVFSSDLNSVEMWDISGTDGSHAGLPSGIAVDKQGNIIVSVNGIDRIHKYNTDYEFVGQWGINPQNPGQFNFPNDVLIDDDSDVFIVDSFNRRIQKFNAFGAYLTHWHLNDNGQDVASPIKIAKDSNGNIYVLDNIASQVQKFDSSGNKDNNWALEEGIIEVDNDYPTDLAIFEDQFLYIAGGYNDHVHKFSLDDGSHIMKWGGTGSGNGKFKYPFGVAVGQNGDVYVADVNNYRIQKFDGDGNYITKWGGQGSMPGQFFGGTLALKTDANGYIYVLDANAGRIQVFSSSGGLISIWDTKSLAFGEQLYTPRGFDIDKKGNIFIADTGNNRILHISDELLEPDPETGLIQNGNFNSDVDGGRAVPSMLLESHQVLCDTASIAGLDYWMYGGDLPLCRTDAGFEGFYSVRMGDEIEFSETGTGSGTAWISQVFFVPYDNVPFLSFNYKIFTNDTIDHADFIVEIQDAVGLNNRHIIVRDGYQPLSSGERPASTQELEWKTVVRHLGKHRGKFVRLMITNRNLTYDARGIWSFIEKINVGWPEFELPNKTFLPLLLR